MTATATAEAAIHRLRPFPSLDGLRGLAVAAVVLFHFPTNPWIPGGQFGVDVFFVLSGFLVTAGLMDDRDRNGDIGFGSFARRRARRLVPALAAFLAVFVVMAFLFEGRGWFTADPFGAATGPIPLTRSLKGAAFAILYMFNVALIRRWPTAMPLAHLWTLAIEGQFYVGWALLLRTILRRRPSALLPVTAGLIAGSAVFPWLVWHRPDAQPLIYFGTIPRLQQLLAGALLAQVWRIGLVERVPYAALRMAACAGGACLLAICLEVGNQTFKYLGALTVNAAATSAVVGYLLVARAGAASVAVLSSAPLRWLGLRSYAIYLWHWPVAVWTQQIDHRIGVPVGLAASLVLGEASWRLVEKPFRRKSVFWRKIGRTGLPWRRTSWGRKPSTHRRGLKCTCSERGRWSPPPSPPCSPARR